MRASEEEGYRMRARLHARNGKIGFFREGTHDLCDAARTRQLLPGSIDALRQLEATLRDVAVTSCELSENAAATERAVLLELAPSAGGPDHIDPIEGISGLLFIDHQQGHMTVSYGSPYVSDLIPASDTTVALTHHVQSFFQGNRHLLPELVTQSARTGSGRNGDGAVRRRGPVRRFACSPRETLRLWRWRATARARAISNPMRRRMAPRFTSSTFRLKVT